MNRAYAFLVNKDYLSGLNLSHKTRSNKVKRAGLRGQAPGSP